MLIKNALYYNKDFEFSKADILIENGKIKEILDGASKSYEDKDDDIINADGMYTVPGFIDIHFHGCIGEDFGDADIESTRRMSKHQASKGVLAMSPATMTVSVPELIEILKKGREYRDSLHDLDEADILGITMEGPFISTEKKGAQDERNIHKCNIDTAMSFIKASDGLVRFITVAPEESENSNEFIEYMKEYCDIAIGHSNADYDSAYEAFNHGANHVIHLYNAMSPFSHRSPGIIGASFDSPDVYNEIICDGFHIHPSAVRAAFKMMGRERMILISDSMRAAGMPDGIYTLGGQDVEVKGNKAIMVRDGHIAASITNMYDCFKVAVNKMNIPLEDAIMASTINPAKSLHVYDKRGSIEEGKLADILIIDKDLSLKKVIKNGKLIHDYS